MQKSRNEYRILNFITVFSAISKYVKYKICDDQLIWKITPKIVPCDLKIVEMAAYIAAGVFNEGTASLLYYISAIGLSVGPNAYLYAQKEDAQCVMISDRRAQESTREGRMIRRQHQIELLEATEGMAGLLHDPGIDDSM